jgi:hypothetical protein
MVVHELGGNATKKSESLIDSRFLTLTIKPKIMKKNLEKTIV